jgi:hypothetical protein
MSDTTSWIEATQHAYNEVTTLLNASWYWAHPLTGYTRAGQALTVLVKDMERAAALAGEGAPPWGMVWDARAIRDAIETLAPVGDIVGLIRDARWTIGTEIAALNATPTDTTSMIVRGAER